MKIMEKKLDNQTRLHVLWDALPRVRDGGYMCKAITRELRRRDIVPPGFLCDEPATGYALYYFPELLKYKPEEASLYSECRWFGGFYNKGVTARRAAIMERLMAEIAEQELN
jgi:hypothetical protein